MRLDESNKMPLARSEGLVTQKVGDEAVVYDLETKEAHCLKRLAAFVLDASDGSTPIHELAASARAEVDAETTDEQVAGAVAELEQVRLLEGPMLLVVDGNGGVSRREMMRRIGYAGAAATVSTGFVMSIASPTAAASCSGQPAGCACSQNKECASNHCCKLAGSNDKCNDGCCSQFNNGADCQCQPNGTCASIPGPPNGVGCCNQTLCTPNNPAQCSTTGPATTQGTVSQSNAQGTLGGTTSTTPGGGGTGGGTVTAPGAPSTGGGGAGGGTVTAPGAPSTGGGAAGGGGVTPPGAPSTGGGAAGGGGITPPGAPSTGTTTIGP